METFVPQNPISVDSFVRRWTCASLGGLLAVAGYMTLNAGAAPQAAVPIPAAAPASAVQAAVMPVAQEMTLGAFLSAEPQLNLVNGIRPDEMDFETERLPVVPTSALSPDAVEARAADANPSNGRVRPITVADIKVTPPASARPLPAAAETAPAIPETTPAVVSAPAPVKASTPPPATPVSREDDARLAAVTWTPATPPDAKAKGMIVASGLNQEGRLAITVNRTAEVKTSVPVKRVSIGQPDIADVQPFATNLLLVTAKKPGTTQVIVWDENDESQSIDVSVEIPLDQLKDLIAKIAPGANIEVAVANDQIVLRGQAPDLTVAKQITDLAGAYGKVQNFIEVAGAQTVAVQVQFAEVSRNVTNTLGVNWGFSDGTTIFGFQPGGSGGLGFHTNDDNFIDDLLIPSDGGGADAFGRFRFGSSAIGVFIKALRENNLLRVLQEPTLTTTSGEAASFLAGGQVPVPVPGANGQTQIEYKEFGVRLKLTPIVLGNGKIRLVVEAESSDLDYANGTKIREASVPGLRMRRVQNTVELGEGQTMSVAGLLDDSVVATRQSLPGLGDLPVIGQLFRSTRYQRKETELVILITPRLSGAMNPDQVPPLPGAAWRHPTELEQFAFGDMGGNAEADEVRDWAKKPGDRGLKPGETQKNTTRVQEPAALTKATARPEPAELPSPPTFIGEHGFMPAAAKKDGIDPAAGAGKQ